MSDFFFSFSSVRWVKVSSHPKYVHAVEWFFQVLKRDCVKLNQKRQKEYLLYVLSYSILACSLANFCDISSTEALSIFGQCSQIDIFWDRWFSQAGFKDLKTWLLIRERNINQLVKTTRPQKCWVNYVRSVGSPNYEHGLLCRHAIHFSKKLVQNPISSTTCIPNTASSLQWQLRYYV